MKKKEIINHYVLDLMKLETARYYAVRHLNLVDYDIAKLKSTIQELQDGKQ